MTSTKNFWKSIARLKDKPTLPGRDPYTLEILADMEARIEQFTENLDPKNQLPDHYRESMTASLADLRKRHIALLAGDISVEVALSDEPLPVVVEEELPATDIISQIAASLISDVEPIKPEVVADDFVSPIFAVSPDGGLPFDAATLQEIVERVRAQVTKEVLAEAAKLVVQLHKDAVRQVAQEMRNAQ